MELCSITVEGYSNNRTTQGLMAIEDHWSTDEGFSVMPGPRHFDIFVATLDDLDLGRYCAEGVAYIADLLNCVQGDIITTTLED